MTYISIIIANAITWELAIFIFALVKTGFVLVLNSQLHFMGWDATVGYVAASVFFATLICKGLHSDSSKKEKFWGKVLFFFSDIVLFMVIISPWLSLFVEWFQVWFFHFWRT